MRESRMAGKARPSGAQVGFARAGTTPGWSSPGSMAIRPLAVKRGEMGLPSIDELEVGPLRVRELMVGQEV